MTKRILFWAFVSAMAVAPPARGQESRPPVPVRLADLVAEAESKHPAIRAAAQAIAAKRARVPQARAWPEPELSIGYMGDIAPFKTQRGDPSSFRQFGVMQEIPYPGKRDLRGKIAEKEVAAEEWTLEAARRRVRAEVKLGYFDLWATDRSIEITQKNKTLLETVARISEERYRVGKGLQQDVLRAQVEITRVAQRLAILQQRRRTLEAQLNSLLLRAPESPIGPLEPIEATPLAYTVVQLMERGEASATEIRRQEQFIEQSEQAITLAKKDYYPDFAVGWDYQNRGGMPEMYGLRFTVKLPVFYKSRQRQALTEAAATLAANRETREAARTAVAFQVKEQYLAAQTAEQLLILYSKGIVPQSTLALDASLAAYQVGSLDFLSVITNVLTILDYEVSYYEELANHEKALARLEEITGVALTPGGKP